MSSAGPTPAERALATVIYAPIGLGAMLVEDLPDAVVKARQRLVFARFIGKIAVDHGVRDLRDRWDGLTNPGSSSATGKAASLQPRGPRTDDPVTAPRPRVARTPDALALPDYDQLPAAHIVGMLGGLTSGELDAIGRYETAHRHRRTVLGKISQLRGV